LRLGDVPDVDAAVVVQGIGVSLMLVQGLVGVYSILISSWMFVYFR
jgi:hypothetical protein